jgi:hypothetical protein
MSSRSIYAQALINNPRDDEDDIAAAFQHDDQKLFETLLITLKGDLMTTVKQR